MTKDEALRMALGVLERLQEDFPCKSGADRIAIIKEVLAQPEQEPDGYVQTVIEALYENSDPVSVDAAELLQRITAQRKPLTLHEIVKLTQNLPDLNSISWVDLVRAVEAAHDIEGEKS